MVRVIGFWTGFTSTLRRGKIEMVKRDLALLYSASYSCIA